MSEQEIKHYNNIDEIYEEHKRNVLKERGIPYEKYNIILHGNIGNHKNIFYASKLISDGLDNEMINKRLRMYKGIEISEEGLNKKREELKASQKEYYLGEISSCIDKNNNITNIEIKNKLKNNFKFIHSEIDNLSDEYLDFRRNEALKYIRGNKAFEAITKNITLYEYKLMHHNILLNRIRKEGLEHCPYCLSLIEPNHKINIEKTKKHKRLLKKKINRAMEHRKKTMIL